jgi:hypothetical protein
MATHRLTASPLILAGGFALAALGAPTIVAPATSDAPATTCPAGESEDLYTTACTPDLVPNSPSPMSATPGNPDLPSISEIPCNGNNSGQCIGLAEQQQAQTPLVKPHTSVSSSPES